MTFVSYAQNFEDVMLWRALRHIENGLYVDVGAQHPLVDSVSRAFYEQGWRGVHIEPVPAYAELLRRDRPDETVLQVALADTEGVLALNVIPDTGLSTAVDAYAERHHAEHGFAPQLVQVPMLTMKSALRFLAGREVHWLKIDVEGLEERVLKGWDSAVLRPWVLVVEATVPTSEKTDYTGWEPLVLRAGYRFAWFDGLNRFYVANEHPELLPAFDRPPNVFDAVRLSGLANSELCRGVLARQEVLVAEARTEARAGQEAVVAAAVAAARAQGAEDAHKALDGELQAERALNTQINAKLLGQREEQRGEQQAALREFERLHAHIAWMQQELSAAQQKAEGLNQSSHHWWTASQQITRQLELVYASTSWKVTAPMRALPRAARALGRLPLRAARLVLRTAFGHPAVKPRVLRLLAASPGLEQRLRKLAVRTGVIVPAAPAPAPLTPVQAPNPATELDERLSYELSPRAARILAQLHSAIEAKAG